MGGQRYRIVGRKDHYGEDGRYIGMLVYEAVCAEPGCNKLFRYPGTKSNIKRKHVNRRCEAHKAPGCPVALVPTRTTAARPQKPASAVKRAPAAQPPPYLSYLD